ncbi:hypothetical protein, partial [Halorubrum ezzemoulense]|uniref:hypothetical protein n=1 Tax=Halorubrum ezzemoulense TaxID=337243 RepID=UPI00232C3D3A
DVERQFEQQFKGDPARGIPGVNVAREAARRQAADDLGVDVEDVELSRQDGELLAEAEVPQPSFNRANINRVEAANARNERRSTTVASNQRPTGATVTSDTSPGALATLTGTAASTLANNPLGNAIGSGADALFGTDSADSGVLGDVADRLDTEAQDFDSAVADKIRQSDPSQTQPVAPGVGGLSATANTDFFRNSAATA